MMFGFGWIMMFLVIGLPIFLVVLLVAAAAGFIPNLAGSGSPMQSPSTVNQPSVSTSIQAATAARYCSHCGTGLLSDWTHCPQCGAPIQ